MRPCHKRCPNAPSKPSEGCVVITTITTRDSKPQAPGGAAARTIERGALDNVYANCETGSTTKILSAWGFNLME